MPLHAADAARQRIREILRLAFIARLAAQDRSLPAYVREEFEAFLRCGVLENGFLRVVCEQCHADKFVGNEFEQP